MILPFWLFVTIVLLLSVLGAGFGLYFIFKAFPNKSGKESSGRGCLGMVVFMILFWVILFPITFAIPQSTIFVVGPGKYHAAKKVLFCMPHSFRQQNNIEDAPFEMNATYVLNRSDRYMIIFSEEYGIGILTEKNDNVVGLPPHELTRITPDDTPDYFFYTPPAISVKTTEPMVQQRRILDYSPLQP